MSEGTTRYLGLDVHKATITVAVAEESGPPTALGTIANEVGGVRRLIRQLGREAKLWRRTRRDRPATRCTES